MSNQVIRNERAGDVFGVPGRFFNVVADPANPAIIRNQKWVSESRSAVAGWGKGARLAVEIRFDDDCGNGHNSFAVTGEIRTPREWLAGGCLHDEIAAVFPELAPLIRWHLCSTDGPMHYIANAVYLAGDRDCNGKRKGEPLTYEERIQFGDFPITRAIGKKFAAFLAERKGFLQTAPKTNPQRQLLEDLTVIEVPHPRDPKTYSANYTISGFDVDWYAAPFKDHNAALEFCLALASYDVRFIRIPTSYSEGKERELDKARSAAVWPEATDEQLSAEPEELKAMLTARLPALINAMRDDVTRAGFLWSQE